MSKNATKEDNIEVEQCVHLLADTISPIYKDIAPTSYQNMTAFEHYADACWVGKKGKALFRGNLCLRFLSPPA